MIVAELKITIDDKGAVAVSGPIDQTLFCYGLLEIAKDTVRAHNAESAKKIQKPGFGDLVAFGKQ